MGLRHATEPDHVTTVATMGSYYKKHLLVGFLWSAGHSGMIMLAALSLHLLGINLSSLIPLSWDVLVGIAMMIMAVFVVRPKHQHTHMHFPDTIHHHRHHEGHHIQMHKPALFGMLHGLAGSAAAMLLFSNNLLFLGIFNIGVMVSMFLMTLLIGRIAPRLNIEKARLVLSGIAFGVGLMLVLQHVPGLH